MKFQPAPLSLFHFPLLCEIDIVFRPPGENARLNLDKCLAKDQCSVILVTSICNYVSAFYIKRMLRNGSIVAIKDLSASIVRRGFR